MTDPILWIARTWADVVEGDLVRPPGHADKAARVVRVGPALKWHVDPAGNPRWPRPLPRVRRAIVLDPDPGPAVADGVNPDAPIEIAMTEREVRVMNMLGGWPGRLRVDWR